METEMEVLQLAPLIASGEEELHRKHRVCRWDGLPNQGDWLEAHGNSVRAVVTGGHLGVTNDMIKRLPSLGLIAIAGVGYEKVDLELARSRGVRVTNTPDILTEDVADLAIGLMISTLRGIAAGDSYVRSGRWKTKNMDLATKAYGRQYGIFGLGRIGQSIAKRLEGFGGAIGYTAREQKRVSYAYHSTLLDLAKTSDVLFVTAAGGAGTRNLIGRQVLDALGPKGFLINVARGSIIDEPALIAALRERRLGGAGLDVYADEPGVPEELMAFPNVTLTPHIGSATVDARAAMANLTLANLDAFFSGRPLPTPVV
jgi:hydroxypyruvate reductase